MINNRALQKASEILPPQHIGSYDADDVTFLLKELGSELDEASNEVREGLIQSGVHYSEMLPIEYTPSKEYIELFRQSLDTSASKVALACGTVAELIHARRGKHVVLASLARGGTPIGILIRRYLKQIHQADVNHYSISIIRGKGMDENALLYILAKHPDAQIQFVDGWTGKGAITKVLKEAVVQFYKKYSILLNDDLAVLADPAHCARTFGTREDFLIPSACLNSTVSGLLSRTVHRDDLIGENDFHGAKFYKHWEKDDVSRLFVDSISSLFPEVASGARQEAKRYQENSQDVVTWKGLEDIKSIQTEFGISDIHLIKPGVGETTRVLLRRVPWQILVNRLDNPNLRHILLLAKDRGVPVIEHERMTYSCCGIIKPMEGGEA